jgi:hypothetical protein
MAKSWPNKMAMNLKGKGVIEVLKAKSLQLPETLTVSWAIEAVARLGGYLEHRRKTPIGIQVLWRGWAKLYDLVEGWQLASQT